MHLRGNREEALLLLWLYLLYILKSHTSIHPLTTQLHGLPEIVFFGGGVAQMTVTAHPGS